MIEREISKKKKIPESKHDIVPTSRIAWFSIDRSDNDPEQFLGYFVTALAALEPDAYLEELRQLTGSGPNPVPPEHLLIMVINELAELAGHAYFFLDDYHFIENSKIHDLLLFFLDNMPVGMHLVMSTRSDPPFPLARLRTQGQLLPLGAKDLRFTEEETASFWELESGIGLSGDLISILSQRTEGWIAGI